MIIKPNGNKKPSLNACCQDYDAEDIEECKAILLKECDLNHDGRIDKEELSMVLISFAKVTRPEDSPLQQGAAQIGK